MTDAITGQFEVLKHEFQTLEQCLSDPRSLQCIERLWDELATLDTILKEAHLFDWGDQMDRYKERLDELCGEDVETPSILSERFSDRGQWCFATAIHDDEDEESCIHDDEDEES